MAAPFKIHADIDYPASKGEVVFVSIGADGTPGELNTSVLKALGLSEKALPSEKHLTSGHIILDQSQYSTIIFIVTVSRDSTENNLKKNMVSALSTYQKDIVDKFLWIPLMGTGAGGLDYLTSFNISFNEIKKIRKPFHPNQVVFSLPKDIDKKTYSLIQKETEKWNEQTNADTVGSSETDSLTDEEKLTAALQTLRINNATKQNRSFFVGGFDWNGEKKHAEFLKDGTWENGWEDKFQNVVDSAQVGDIIFLKSTARKKEGGYLRLHAIGVIFKNQKGNGILKVNWFEFNEEIELKRGAHLRNAIQKVGENYIDDILREVLAKYPDLPVIVEDLSKHFSNPENDENTLTINPSKIAQQIADLDKGEDYLGIDKDVTAFAKVIASNSFSPPLAIALFGQWGMGKSFFMRKLEDKIESLSKSGNPSFKSGFCHIQLNAWSYLDSNLWASIVSIMFKELNKYINDVLDDSEDAIQEIDEALGKNLQMLNKKYEAFQSKKQQINQKTELLKREKARALTDLEDKKRELRKSGLTESLKIVDEEFKLQQRLIEALGNTTLAEKNLEAIQAIIPQRIKDNPSDSAQYLDSYKAFFRVFFRKESLLRNIIFLVVASAIILFIPVAITYFANQITILGENKGVIQFFTAITAFMVAIRSKYKSTVKYLGPFVSAFWKVKKSYELKVEEAKANHSIKIQHLQIELEEKSKELETINRDLKILESEKDMTEFKLNNLLVSEALSNFISKQASGDKYKQHLGIVSVIRDDFEMLNKLFLGHGKESDSFRKAFGKNPLERIVLYVDDLDRCSEDRVIEVLEAVNLLMAFPLFVVVVGVDPRWVKNALIKKYKLQFGERSDINGYEHIEASNYLEKIFQIPFHLEQASDNSVKLMLKELSSQSMTGTVEISDEESEPDEDRFVYSTLVSSDGITLKDNQGTPLKTIVKIRDTKAKEKNEEEIDEHLSLSDSEVKLFQEMSGIIGVNPRAIKRFVNIYRIVRAHEGLTLNSNDDSEYLALMFLLALPMGPFNSIHKEIIQSINSIGSKNPDAVLGDLLSLDKPSEPILIGELRKIISQSEIKELIRNLNLLNLSQHNKFIQRFTFSDLA